MGLDLHAPLVPEAVRSAADFLKLLPTLSQGTFFRHVYLHWSVERWGCLDGSYNAEIDLEGGVWVMKVTHDPRHNAVQVVFGGDYAAHTYARNSHAFGIAITGMIDAKPTDFGPQAVQIHEIEHLCAAAAAVCIKYGLDPTAVASDGEFVIMTHAEAAIKDRYFPGDGDPDSRWDLARLAASSLPLTKAEALATAAMLRARVQQYKLALRP